MSKQRQDEYKCPLEVTMEIIGGKSVSYTHLDVYKRQNHYL